MNPKQIIEIIIMVLQLIAKGLSMPSAIEQTASAFHVNSSFVSSLFE